MRGFKGNYIFSLILNLIGVQDIIQRESMKRLQIIKSVLFYIDEVISAKSSNLSLIVIKLGISRIYHLTIVTDSWRTEK